VPEHSTFSKNRHGRFRDSGTFRWLFDEVLRRINASEQYQRSRKQRKKVEMLFAHLKRILRLDRLRLRGLSGAFDEFTLAATAQNLRRLAKLAGHGPLPNRGVLAPA